MGSLFDNIRKVYKIQVLCKNCGELTEANVPKGMLVQDFLDDKGKCENCGTVSLERYTGGKLKDSEDKNVFDKRYGTFKKSK